MCPGPAECRARANIMTICYLRKLRLRTMAGSTALPLQIWKKLMILMTNSAAIRTIAAIGTMIVQHRTAAAIQVSIEVTLSLTACLMWNLR